MKETTTMATLVERMERNDLFSMDVNAGDCDGLAAELESSEHHRKSIGAGFLARRERIAAMDLPDARSVVLCVIALVQMMMLIYFTVGQP